MFRRPRSGFRNHVARRDLIRFAWGYSYQLKCFVYDLSWLLRDAKKVCVDISAMNVLHCMSDNFFQCALYDELCLFQVFFFTVIHLNIGFF